MGKRKDAARLATVAGILLLLAGASGSAAMWILGVEVAARFLPPAWATLALALGAVLSLFAALGGATVLIGARLIRTGPVILGKILVDVGAGMGAVGLVLHLVPVLVEDGLRGALAGLATFQGLGILLAILAGWRAPRA